MGILDDFVEIKKSTSVGKRTPKERTLNAIDNQIKLVQGKKPLNAKGNVMPSWFDTIEGQYALYPKNGVKPLIGKNQRLKCSKGGEEALLKKLRQSVAKGDLDKYLK